MSDNDVEPYHGKARTRPRDPNPAAVDRSDRHGLARTREYGPGGLVEFRRPNPAFPCIFCGRQSGECTPDCPSPASLDIGPSLAALGFGLGPAMEADQ